MVPFDEDQLHGMFDSVQKEERQQPRPTGDFVRNLFEDSDGYEPMLDDELDEKSVVVKNERNEGEIDDTSDENVVMWISWTKLIEIVSFLSLFSYYYHYY